MEDVRPNGDLLTATLPFLPNRPLHVSMWIKTITRGVFWVFEHPRNFREKSDTQKQIYY